MREIVLDTETTGLDPEDGHRIVEIACIELVHHVPTGRSFHRYVNPERDVPADAVTAVDPAIGRLGSCGEGRVAARHQIDPAPRRRARAEAPAQRHDEGRTAG